MVSESSEFWIDQSKNFKIQWGPNKTSKEKALRSYNAIYQLLLLSFYSLIEGDFLVGYEGPGCGLVSFSSGNLEIFINCQGATWSFQDIHPNKNHIIVGNIFGLLVLFNYLNNERICEKTMTIEDEITCVKFSACGQLLAIGKTSN